VQLEHSFTVPVPVEQAWQALLDPERVAPCFPGASLTEVDESGFSGTVKVRMGPIALLYKGSGRFTTADVDARRVVLEATGKDSRGNGTAAATVTATLAEADTGTRVDVVTDLTITGRPAQLGRGLVGEVGGKLLDAFAGCLATRLSASYADERAPAGGADDEPPEAVAEPARPVSAADEIDLIGLAGQPVLKRVMPAIAGVLLVLLVLRWLRRRG
jgi:uncharacterized protein